MGTCRRAVTKHSDCFRWLKKLKYERIYEFYFRELPIYLKDNKMLHRAAASGLLKQIEINNNGTKKWKLNRFEMNKIENKNTFYL